MYSPRLSFNNAVWHTHLSAQSWQPNNNFDWIYIVSDAHQLCFLALDQFGDVIDSVLDDDRFLLRFWFPCSFLLRELSESHFLLRVGFWTVLVQQLEELGGRLLVQA